MLFLFAKNVEKKKVFLEIFVAIHSKMCYDMSTQKGGEKYGRIIN